MKNRLLVVCVAALALGLSGCGLGPRSNAGPSITVVMTQSTLRSAADAAAETTTQPAGETSEDGTEDTAEG